MNLAWKPDYNHKYQQRPPVTSLDFATAKPVYEVLKSFLAIQKYPQWPAEGWEDRLPDGSRHRDLFTPRGFHYAVRWKPELEPGWERLTYFEFCAWYGIPERVEES